MVRQEMWFRINGPCPPTSVKLTLSPVIQKMRWNSSKVKKQLNTHACMHARTHARTHAHTHARTHTHTHTHTCTCGKNMFFFFFFLIIQTDSLNKILHRNNACYKKKNLIIQTDLLNKILDRNIACYCHNFLQENKITHLRKMKNTHHTSKY